jgi:hypothetical protein
MNGALGWRWINQTSLTTITDSITRSIHNVIIMIGRDLIAPIAHDELAISITDKTVRDDLSYR